jgi:hypothetical protein
MWFSEGGLILEAWYPLMTAFSKVIIAWLLSWIMELVDDRGSDVDT